MNIQKSFDQEKGTLYVVPTPIGNLEDITFRALNVLKTVSVIAAEDTRNTKKLLTHFNISTTLMSYHEHNKKAREDQLLAKLDQGDSIAIVSDAGMPGISDPGYEMVAAAIRHDFPVVVLPGANAALCALIGSGLPTKEFLFYGFLPRKKKEKEQELDRLEKLPATLIFYESPYRVKETLKAIKERLGGARTVGLARELTKRFEEYIRGTVDEVNEWLATRGVKGECCIIVEGNTGDLSNKEQINWWHALSVKAHVTHYMEHESLTSKEAIKRVAADRHMQKREVYHMYHVD